MNNYKGEQSNKKNPVYLYLIVIALLVTISVFTGCIDNENNIVYDFRYYGEDYYIFGDSNVSVRFYSHDKFNDTLTFLFFKDGNYTITVFYDIEDNFSGNYRIDESVNVTGIGSVYPYINEAYEYKIERIDLFNPSIMIEFEYGYDRVDFETRFVGVDVNKP